MNNQFGLLDFLTILSFVVGVYALDLAKQNLVENRLQSKDSEEILHQLEVHLKAQDKHLAFQDKLLGKEENIE